MVNNETVLYDRSDSSYRIKNFFRRNWAGWLIMLPSIVLFAFFVWYPMLKNVYMSFTETRGYTIVGSAGFDNYTAIFTDERFTQALVNTFVYVLWSIVIGFLVPIVLGLFLSEVVHFKGVFRMGIYFPCIISGMAVILLWSYLFDPADGAVLNALFSSLGWESSRFLTDKALVIPLLVVIMTWRGAGGTVLIYLSALQNVDNSQYEAARMDGAGVLNRIRYVTIPHMLPTIRMLFVLQIISVFQVFYEPLVLTDGGPNNASVTLGLLVYEYGIEQGEYGLSAAASVILSVIIIIFTLIYLYLSNPNRGKRRVKAK